MPYFTAGSETIHFSEAGRGRLAVVLLHGWYQNGSQAWSTLVPYLGTAYRIFIPDLPGHGLSRLNDAQSFSVERVDELLCAFIHEIKKKYGCTKVCIVGHSYGAFAVERLLARFPGLLHGAVALAAIDDYKPFRRRLKQVLWVSGIFPGVYFRLQALLALFPYGDRVLLYGKMPEALVPGRLAYARIKNKTLSTRWSRAYMRAFLYARVPWREQKIRTPLLLVYGERDALTSSQWAQRILRHAESAEVVVIPDAGHNVQITGAAALSEHLKRFFEKSFRHH